MWDCGPLGTFLLLSVAVTVLGLLCEIRIATIASIICGRSILLRLLAFVLCNRSDNYFLDLLCQAASARFALPLLAIMSPILTHLA